MPRITLRLPSLLTAALGQGPALALEATTLRAALDAIRREHPALALHLFDETGGLREHVLCFWNGTNTRWLDTLDQPLAEGDTLLVMQAVSGG